MSNLKRTASPERGAKPLGGWEELPWTGWGALCWDPGWVCSAQLSQKRKTCRIEVKLHFPVCYIFQWCFLFQKNAYAKIIDNGRLIHRDRLHNISHKQSIQIWLYTSKFLYVIVYYPYVIHECITNIIKYPEEKWLKSVLDSYRGRAEGIALYWSRAYYVLGAALVTVHVKLLFSEQWNDWCKLPGRYGGSTRSFWARQVHFLTLWYQTSYTLSPLWGILSHKPA